MRLHEGRRIVQMRMGGNCILAAAIALAALPLLLVPAAAAPATAPSDPEAQTQARIKAMDAQIVGLQKQLTDSYAHNKVLQDQNAALLGRLAATAAPGAGPNASPSGSTFGKAKQAARADVPAVIVVTLADPQWDADGTAPAQPLRTGLDGTAVVLKPMDDTIAPTTTAAAADPTASPSTQPTDKTHVSFGVQHFNRGLGTQSYVPVGKIWLDAGVLYLQWTDKEHQADAMAAMQFAVVQVSGSADAVTTIQFFKPTDVSISTSHASTTKLVVPTGLTGPIKLKTDAAPTGWQIMKQGDTSIVEKSDDLTWQLTYGPTPPQLFFTRTGGLQQKIDSATAEVKTKQRDLDAAQTAAQNAAQTAQRNAGNGAAGAAARGRNRAQQAGQQGTQLTSQIGAGESTQEQESLALAASLRKQIATLNQSIATMKTQVATDERQWTALDGSTVSAVLANGAYVANVTLASDK